MVNINFKNHIIKLIVIVLFIIGVVLLLYPYVSNWFSKRNHSRLIQNYNVTAQQLEQFDIEKELLRARQYNDSLTGKNITDPFIPDSGYVVPKEYASILNIDGIIGYIEIPAISAFLPIYHGVGEDILQKGIGHMNATAFPIGGEGCHAVLTGHRGLPSSELFSNLNKLKTGDVFFIHVLNEVLAYRVVLISVVEPGDTNHLRPEEKKDYVSLVTCTPYSINSHRLVVRGERSNYTPEDSNNFINSDTDSTLHKILRVLLSTAPAVISGIIYTARHRQRYRLQLISHLKGVVKKTFRFCKSSFDEA